MPESQPTVHRKRPTAMLAPRAFGVEDRPPCPVMWRRDALVPSFPRARLPWLRSASVLLYEMQRGNHSQLIAWGSRIYRPS